MKIFISGPMSSLPNFNRQAFHEAARMLDSQGHVVLNPATLPDGLNDKEYMDICTAMLFCADAIYLLPEWKISRGARAEHALAEKLGLLIIPDGGL
ncbi:DUF4406 domain-containing protein [Kosakonia radicincitans]|uniref:DUF4406 domain-containing protein n=1 Tax=Kosakonia radicincitans TaxID=283686 RepID=UPI001D0955E4|nr:DUF4406 domain-containing protein [Kosakonia radicincitans]